MNRRGFLGAALYGLGAVLSKAYFGVPKHRTRLPPGSVVDLDWYRMAAPRGSPFTTAEVRYRVDGGEWIRRFVPVEDDGKIWKAALFSNVWLGGVSQWKSG